LGTWVRDGTTVNLEDDTDTVSIGAGATPPGVKLDVVGGPARLVLEDKGGEVHDVRAYGAVGDGIADDTVAVNSAIAAAEAAPRGGIVYFPPGRYRITNALGLPGELLTVRQPLQLLGAGPLLSIITTDDATRHIFHCTFAIPDINDKVVPFIFRDLKIEASVTRTAGSAIEQDVTGNLFQHGIRIENCHFKGQHVGIHLTGASGSVIENCTFWQGIASEADVWIDEQTGSDSSAHLITGCLFGDTTGTASKAVKITGKSGGDRIVGNLFAYYENQIYFEMDGGGGPGAAQGTSQLIHGNIMEAARTAAIRMTGADRQRQTVISGNAIRQGAAAPGGALQRCLLADPVGPEGFAHFGMVVGNKFAGDLGGSKGIELSPTGGAATPRWFISDNQFEGFTTALEFNGSVTELMLGCNAFLGNAANMVDSSTAGRGATFLDRVGIGAENTAVPTKELHLKSALAGRPRVYLEGMAGVSSPGVEFAFDAANTRRAAMVGTAAGTSGTQLELFTKPDGAGIAQRLVLDKDGNALWRTPNYQEMISVSVDPGGPAAGRARLFLRDNGSGKTQFCVRFASGSVQVLATEP
jgi:hypothetical protein